jgi:hypothetical protein
MRKIVKEMNNVVQLSEYRKKARRKQIFWMAATRIFILCYLGGLVFLALKLCNVV